MSIYQLQPANHEQTKVYIPYIQINKRSLLPYAISLYQQGVLEGHRKIESSEDIPFLATWNITALPSDLTCCRIQFDGDSELTYEVMIATFEFISLLIELIENQRRYHSTDFSQNFYRKLFRADHW
ncbi:hypothetical protein H6G25_15800 [Dolichospermum sp. FACHB-1091]|jgi:hypothetical protein|uniref:type IV pilus biogenesis protein EbsA n=1 Tax=Dolichospermum sp. FACHB-1091 TaxID=2692798 RepID=UPI0016806E89|nr:type IV pilus biogenesis protein EbsA [Dolichospermum sp. FACHB-1091]MBD2444623.1 hypothetical protein [Dolichospermum sp. FACHB-1091]